MLYTLSLDKNFAPFLVTRTWWEKKTKNTAFRGFADDNESIPEGSRLTRMPKVNMLELMLGQIANYCPVISRNKIVKTSTSVDQIWQTIRLHYRFQTTGAHFIDFDAIRYDPSERPKDLFQRLTAFVEDNLLRKDIGITHHGQTPEDDEELSPSMENFVVLTWLRLLHLELPKLVKQRYGTELPARTLASIKPKISQALDSLLEELRTSDDAKAMRTAVNKFSKTTNKQHTTSYRSRSCPLCKTAGRPDNHFLSKCTFLPLQDRQFMAKARAISEIHDVEDLEDSTADSIQPVSSSRIQVRQSPYVDTFHGHIPIRLTIDSGATGNMMRASTATKLNAKITGSFQSAHQADGSSPLTVLGETRLHFTRSRHELYFEGLVVENTEVLAGIPFMEMNDIFIRPSRCEVCIGNKYVYTYGSSAFQTRKHTVCRAHIVRAPPQSVTLLPGDFIEVDLPEDMLSSDNTFSVEPHSLSDKSVMWHEPYIVSDVSGKIRIPNTTASPLVLRRNEHLCQVRTTFVPEPSTCSKLTPTKSGSSSVFNSDAVRVDPDSLLPVRTKSRFEELLHRYDNVFNPLFSSYNGAVGPLEAKVNMGPVQPHQRKGRVPQYSKDQLCNLQEMFNELKNIGVFKRPEDLGISVEYINTSFLVKKPSGGFRLVTAFADVGRYSKPQPSLMPDVDSTLRQIAQWKYIIISDLTKSFYQIPLS